MYVCVLGLLTVVETTGSAYCRARTTDWYKFSKVRTTFLFNGRIGSGLTFENIYQIFRPLQLPTAFDSIRFSPGGDTYMMCTHAYICIYKFIYIYLYMYMPIYIYASKHIYIYMHIHVCICMNIDLHICFQIYFKNMC